VTEVEKIKEIIKKDENFCKSFLGVKNVKTALSIARSKGYKNITANDVLNDRELEDSLLCAAAGGKGNMTNYNNQTYNYHYESHTNNLETNIRGDNNQVQSGAKS